MGRSLTLSLILTIILAAPRNFSDDYTIEIYDQKVQTNGATITVSDPVDMATAMGVDAVDLVSATIDTSDPDGTGVADEPLTVFPRQGGTFTILSTGLAASAADPDNNNSEVLNVPDSSDDVSTIMDGLNNSLGEDMVRFTMVLRPPPGSTQLSFDFAFFSEEFPDFINLDFNDVFIAELGAEPFSSGITISGTDVTAPANIAFDPNGDIISVNAAFGFDPADPNPDTGTTYDGTSGLLRSTGCLPDDLPTGNVVLIMTITDLTDSLIDSAVFLDNFNWSDSEGCDDGAEQLFIDLSPVTETNPVNTTHVVAATVFDTQGNPVPGQSVGFMVSGANTAGDFVVTDINGQATFTYLGLNPGQDTITAWIDEDEDGLQGTGEPFETVTKIWQSVETGSISITKEVAGAMSQDLFGFAGDLGVFELMADQTQTFSDLEPGDYTVIETILPSQFWSLLFVKCGDNHLPVEAFPTGSGATIPLEAGQDLNCTFHNERATHFEDEGRFDHYFPMIFR